MYKQKLIYTKLILKAPFTVLSF